ncbi:MAG TPA: hydroxymethylglutaryl-CoA lyase [Candidatus Limnocylindria bacterium]|nr:hydroxymethylglutaryl-CoA lyase [Candidatus Limnocylindria bacterium]
MTAPPPEDRLPPRVRVVEVSPRDGLQAEATTLSTDAKLELIDRLVAAGHSTIEATSFVSPKAVPQLADAEELMKRLRRAPGVRYPVLVPNERGLDRALSCGVTDVAVFAAASESYSLKNLGRSREETLRDYVPVVRRAKEMGARVRGYLSMVIADPWDGPTPLRTVVEASRALADMGCDELSLGDTIGVGTANAARDVVRALVSAGIPIERIGVHFHDTYGQALANVLAVLTLGVTTVDASAGGLGGSPFAKSAAGNLATEDLVWMLDGLGIESGVDVRRVAETARWACGLLGREPAGRTTRALA